MTNMKPKKQGAIKHLFRKWGVKDYIRQLSVVIIGIVITFTGSDAIMNHSRQKELKQIMEMVKLELEDNLQTLHTIESRLQRERAAFQNIQNNIQDLDAIPTDTILKYGSVPGNVMNYFFRTQSLDVLKTSGIISQIKDKEFLRNIFGCYVSLQYVEESANGYYTDKKDATFSWLYSLSTEKAGEIMGGENQELRILHWWHSILKNDESRNFFLNAPGNLETVLIDCNNAENTLLKTLSDFEKQ